MEEKKYEGTVQITSAEYRELVTEAVEATARYDAARSEKWQLERKISALEKELSEAKTELDACKNQLSQIAAYGGTNWNPLYPNTITKTNNA